MIMKRIGLIIGTLILATTVWGATLLNTTVNGTLEVKGTSNLNNAVVITGTSIMNSVTSESLMGSELISAAVNRNFSGANNWTGTGWSTTGGAFVHTAGANAANLANTSLEAVPMAGHNYLLTFSCTTTATGLLTPSFGGITTGLITCDANSVAKTFTRTGGSFLTDGLITGENVDTFGFSNAGNNNTFQILNMSSTVLYVDDILGSMVTETSTAKNKTITTTTGIVIGVLTGTLSSQAQIINATGSGPLTFTPNATWTGSIDDISLRDMPSIPPLQIWKNSDGRIANELRSGGSYGGTILQNTFLGYQSGLLVASQASVNSGTGNAGFGSYALASLTTGYGNSGVGNTALASVTTGKENGGFGDNALAATTTGSYNNAFGAIAMGSNVFGSLNTAIGDASMQLMRGGDNNTALGAQTLCSLTAGSGNVALGYGAGYWDTGNNHLWIDNAPRANLTTEAITALIYGTFATTTASQSVTVNGNMNINGSITPTTYIGLPAFGTSYEAVSSEAESTTVTSATFVSKLAFTSGTKPAGTYRVGWSYEIAASDDLYQVESRVSIEGVVVSNPLVYPGSSSYYMTQPGFYNYTAAAAMPIRAQISYRASGGGTARIRDARIEIWRVY